MFITMGCCFSALALFIKWSQARGFFGSTALKILDASEFDLSALSSDKVSLTAESLVITKNHLDSTDR